MQKGKKILGILGGMVLNLFLVTNGQTQQVITIKFADALPPTWCYYQAMKAYKAFVE